VDGESRSGLVGLLLEQMDYTHHRGGWFPPTRRVLEGLTATPASGRATGPGVTHTAWELVNHLAFWKETCARALRGLPRLPGRIENDATFGETGDPADEAGWRAAVDRLATADAAFREAVARLSDADLELPLSAGDVSPREMVSALNVHDGYHLGQIVVLAKLAGRSRE
jgi:uncharacterized damage-inducible protein DinB